MNLNNYFWYFKKALSYKFCDKVIKFGKKQQVSAGKIVDQLKAEESKKHLSKKEINNFKNIRNSNISFLSHQWIYDELWPIIHTANKNAGWNFEFDWAEPAQFTIYNKNQHYNWHVDSFIEPYKNSLYPHFEGKNRKLSVTCSLSDPKEYEGGELHFDFRNNLNGKPNIKKCLEIKEKGSVVVFPSDIWHKVTPVKKGIRYSLVFWFLGKPFK